VGIFPAWANWVLFAAFVHMAGGALRLARFNTQLTSADKRYFQGLPSPAAAAILAGYIWIVWSMVMIFKYSNILRYF